MFPCHPRGEGPRHPHGFLDATTDPGKITGWWSPQPGPEPRHRHRRPRARRPGRRRPRPDGNGFAAFNRLRRAGLLDGAAAYVRTPSGGLHAYFAGSDQRNGRLPTTTWTSAPAAATSSPRPPRSAASPTSCSSTRTAEAGWTGPPSPGCSTPSRSSHPEPAPPGGRGPRHLAGWVARQPEGNRNAGLFWAANRALDADPAADLSPLAAAARQAGLGEREITGTLDSARKSGRTRTHAPNYQPEAGDQA